MRKEGQVMQRTMTSIKTDYRGKSTRKQESKTSAITTDSKTHLLSTITTRVNVVTNYIFPSQYAWYLAMEAPFDFTVVSRHYIK